MAGQPQLLYPVPTAGQLVGIDAYALVPTQTAMTATPPSEIIDPNLGWKATMKFRIGGVNPGLFINQVVANPAPAPAPPVIPVSGNAEFYYEGLGGASDGKLNASPIPVAVNSGAFNPATNTWDFEASVDVLPNTLAPGLYQLAASVVFPTIGFMAYVEGPLVQAY